MTTRRKISFSMPSEASDEAWFQFVDKIMSRYFTPRKNPYKHDFTKFGDLWSPQAMKILCEHSHRWCELTDMTVSLTNDSVYSFWHAVFTNHDHVSPEDLFKLWYLCSFDSREKQRDYRDKFATEAHPSPMFDNPMMLENRKYCAHYVAAKRPGWEMLRYVTGRLTHKRPLPDDMKQALLDDDVASFCMYRDMCRMNLTYSLFEEVIKKSATQIALYILQKYSVIGTIITLPELACLIACNLPDRSSVPLLMWLEGEHPGTLRQFVDPFGRNLLWYALLNQKTGWFHPDCKLTALLLSSGCDPDNVNRIGLSWRTVTESLSYEQKCDLMNRLYCANGKTYSSLVPCQLEKDQPLENIPEN